MQVSQRVHTAAAHANPSKLGNRCGSEDTHNLARRLVGEFIGTLILTWSHATLALSITNTATELPNSPDQRSTIAVNAFASGTALAGLVYSLGHISGAHLNPSISIVLVLRGDMHIVWLLPYVAAQVAGGFTAAGILDAVFINDEAHGNLGANQPSGGFTVLAAFWMEFIGAVFLQLAVVGTASRGEVIGGHAALAAGLTIGSAIGLLSPYGGGSLNPARSVGPGVLAASPSAHNSTWIYVTAPLGAAVITGTVFKWLLPRHDHEGECTNAEGNLRRRSSIPFTADQLHPNNVANHMDINNDHTGKDQIV